MFSLLAGVFCLGGLVVGFWSGGFVLGGFGRGFLESFLEGVLVGWFWRVGSGRFALLGGFGGGVLKGGFDGGF